MKNLRKLSKRDLQTINGGSAPECPDGYNPCMTFDENGQWEWNCVWASLPCRP